MTMMQRRTLLGAVAGSAASLLAACGGGGDAPAAADAAPAAGSTPPDTPAALSAADIPDQTAQALSAAGTVARYRHQTRHLFQTVATRVLKSRLPEGRDLMADVYGPTHLYVDFHTGWPWTRKGGDWIDAALVRHGSQPWFSAPVGAVSGGSAVARYSMDVTRAIAHCQVNKRWCALLLTATAPRAIAGTRHPSEPAPYLIVTYQNGLQARLDCRVVAANAAGSTGPLTASAQTVLPAFTEFEPPAGVITRAVLHLSVTQHWSGTNPQLQGFVIDPPVNTAPVQQGRAAAAGPLDGGLAADPQILGVHRYLDGTTVSDFVLAAPLNFYAEKNFDPAIYGTGARDTSRLPHRGLGKWVTTGNHGMTMVGSGYTGDGFAPLAAGVGALRLAMPAAPGVTDGSVVGYGGTVAGNAMIFLPEELYGRTDRLFVRYYLRIGTPGLADATTRRHVYNAPGVAEWTTCAGKFGITADHSTSYGGNSGSSGGGNGWQMRHAWYDCDAQTGGPDEAGWTPGFHMYDFYYANPPGYNYGKGDSTRAQDQWGQQGGLGGMLYAGQWYCVETEIKLNTVSATAPGFLPDGEQRVWIDGRLAYVRTGMVFRTGPVSSYAYNPDRLRPCRDLGVRGLWLNWFHGGKTLNTMDRALFYTGLAWGQSYIGPMKF